MDYSIYNRERNGYVIICEHKNPNIGVCYVGSRYSKYFPHITNQYREAMFFSTKVVAIEHWNEIKNALLNDSLFTEKYDSYKVMKVHEEISMEEVEELTPDRILSEIEIVPVEE